MSEENQAPEAQQNEQLDVNAAIEKATAALAAKNSQIIAEKRALAEKLKSFEGVDPEEFKTLKQRQEEIEEENLIREKKFEELAQKRAEKAIQEVHKQTAAVQAELEAAKQRINSYADKVLANQIMSAATGKVHADTSTMDVVSMLGRSVFSLDSDGNAVALDSDGMVILGKDGKTPFTPAEWVESLKETHRFLFPNLNSGGGSIGSVGGKVYNNDISKMSAFEKMKYGRQQNATKRI